jgi:hypothetical protein
MSSSNIPPKKEIPPGKGGLFFNELLSVNTQ